MIVERRGWSSIEPATEAVLVTDESKRTSWKHTKHFICLNVSLFLPSCTSVQPSLEVKCFSMTPTFSNVCCRYTVLFISVTRSCVCTNRSCSFFNLPHYVPCFKGDLLKVSVSIEKLQIFIFISSD